MASGDTLCKFSPSMASLPSTAGAFATFDSSGDFHLVLDFDPSTAEECYFTDVMPRHYAGGGVTVRLGFTAGGDNTKNVVWLVAFERHADDADPLSTSGWASDQTVTAAAPNVDLEVKYADIAFTNGAQMDSVAVGEYFRIRVKRNATSGSDTVIVDASLVSVEIRET